MNGSAKRLMAILAVLAMVVSVSTIVLTDEQDSSADVVTTTYYYDQLDSHLAREAYSQLSAMDSFTGELSIDLTPEDKEKCDEDSGFVRKELAKAVDALGYDNPLKNYYFRSYNYSPDNASLSLMQLMWQYAFGGSMNYGKASAVAVIVTLILLVMTAIYSFFNRKESDWD